MPSRFRYRIRALIILAFFSVLTSARSLPAQQQDRLAAIEASKAPAVPVLDGILDDEVWQQPPLKLGEWLSYNPLHGEKIEQKTDVWIAYDRKFLYFAFRCYDPEPAKIRSNISRRDNQWNDDWVGLSLDSMGSGQTSYDMFVNPSGVQGDILTSSSSGEDVSPDWVWDSAGKISETGYCVEIRLPFQSIRFKSGSEVRMGILFWRRVSRLGISVSWPDLQPGKWVFDRSARLLLRDVKRPETREVIPSGTYSLSQERATPERWQKADSRADFGVSLKYGLTSSITLDGTVNPDFSQVESDAFQVTVNQRYPIFYSEKRPFFMEGMGIFNLAGSSGDGNMRTSVHTRRIIDPSMGFKLTGTIGKVSFGTLSASDEAAGRLEEDPATEGKSKIFNIARALYSLGEGNYVGGLFTDTEFAGSYNRAAGADMSFRLNDNQRINSTLLHTESFSDDTGALNGLAAQTSYNYNSKFLNVFSQVEHYDRDFQMDTAFYNRTGITTGWYWTSLNYYPDAKRHPWIKRISPFIFTRFGRDRIAAGNERFGLVGLMISFTRQGFFRVDSGIGREPWEHRIFKNNRTRVMGGAQFTKWLNVFVRSSFGDDIYYDRKAPFQGKSQSHNLNLSFQPNTKIKQDIFYERVEFNRAVNRERVYTVNILNTKTTYQFNKHFFLRALFQFDSSNYELLTDLLASYELAPGTVLYAGYGSLVERRAWRGDTWMHGEGNYLTTKRGLFFKASYLFRF